MVYLVRIVLTLIAFLVSLNAQAVKPKKVQKTQDAPLYYKNKTPVPGDTLWLCAYDGNFSIDCQIAETGQGGAPAVTIDPRLPQVVGTILNTPQDLSNMNVRIPLRSLPYDMEMVGELALSVMCAAKTQCSVLFGETREQLSQLATPYIPVRLSGN